MSKQFDRTCADNGGVQSTKLKHGYEFQQFAAALQAAEALGFNTPEPQFSPDRPAMLYIKQNSVILRLVRYKDEPTVHGWVNGDKTYEARLGQLDIIEQSARDYDSEIRSVVVRMNSGLLADDGFRVWIPVHQHWSRMYSSSVIRILMHFGLDRRDAERVVGNLHTNCWEIVSWPFMPEYPEPGKRIWNLNAPQLRYPNPRPGEHPTWNLVMAHVSAELDQPILRDPWAIRHGIKTGADWMIRHHASIVRQPAVRTPYLFLFGPEDSGKSIVHESFALLVTRGVEKADRALTSEFNGELARAILCVVEEKNLSKVPGAHARVKDAVTALRLSIRKMKTDAYMIDNHTHWIQCSNEQDACFVKHGDTRIQSLYIAELPKEKKIGKELLMERLEAETEAFTHTLLNVELPEPNGRLALEIIDTPSRAKLANDAVPEFVIAVADLACEGKRMLTAGQLAKVLREDFQFFQAPTDMRKVVSMLDENRGYLDQRQVTFELSSRSKNGRLITLDTKAA